MKISAVIITFNEEKNISRCLDSLQNIADEIVVVDSFSTDKTEEICRRYGVMFVKHAFEGHIQQKNWAITQATNDFILSLDADEVLDEILQKSILSIKNNCESDGYTMNRMTNYCGKWIKHGGWYPDKKLRLFDRNKGCWKGTNPHDRYELTNPSAKIKHLKGDILHYSYYSIEEHFAQANKFSTLTANELFSKGKKVSLFMALVRSSWRFFRDYIVKKGFLDGYYGFLICKISSFATFMKYVKLKQLYKQYEQKC